MTSRQRFLETALFGQPDRIPYYPGGPRQSTYDRWYTEGLPQGKGVGEVLGLDHWEGVGVNLGPLPAFEETLLEDRGDHKIWIDSLGARRLDFTVDATPGFVTRTWLEFPVHDRDSFRQMTQRFDPGDPARYPGDWLQRVERYRDRDFVVNLTIPWLFWRVRDWVGFEGLCTLCLDDPPFVHEMMEFVTEFTLQAIQRAVTEVEIDFVFLNEDMAYKTASMISPQMVREFMLPRYRRLVEFLHGHGVRVIVLDCDGHISELIPLWLEVGVNATWPVEIAAGNDPVAYRRQFPEGLCLMGGIDKRELRFDRKRVRREVMSKVPWLIEQGGYIPSVDHGVPPDVPYDNFAYMWHLIQHIATS
ncbi:MAG: uroporphyrinogen decarboxylase family protein [Armatimonadota bacterium]